MTTNRKGATVKYKLTDEHGQTHNKTQWGPGVRHAAQGTDADLCSPGWIHYYDSPLLAALLNPIHANFKRPRLWEFTPEGKQRHDHGLKSGSRAGTTLREILLPIITTAQRVRFAILCAQSCRQSTAWKAWAEAWLSGQDRTERAASAAAKTANRDAAYAAAATYAACAAASTRAAEAADAARVAHVVARAAARAAACATDAADINLIALAKQAVRDEAGS